MREILFRGKDIVGNWHYGDFEYYTDDFVKIVNHSQQEHGKKVERETIGQYTGLTDKNGKKIFEGDIVKDITLPIVCGVGEIKFGEYETKMDSSLINDNYSHHIGFYIKWANILDFRKDLAFWKEKIEVIGNIYDNPGLLKEAGNE